MQLARKKKVVSEEAVIETPPQEISEVEPPTPEPEADARYDVLKAALKDAIDKSPSVADVVQNPMQYHEWKLTLKRMLD